MPAQVLSFGATVWCLGLTEVARLELFCEGHCLDDTRALGLRVLPKVAIGLEAGYNDNGRLG